MTTASRTVSARIHRLSGQLVAIEKMIKNKRPCRDIIYQISAIRSGLDGVSVIILQKELQKLGVKKSWQNKDMEILLKSFINSSK